MSDENLKDDVAVETEQMPDPYTAFQKWEYKALLHQLDEGQERFWISLPDSYFQAALRLVQGVARGELLEDVEGRAAVFLFRHYIELALKRIILRGRFLINENENVEGENVKPVARIHNLKKLWAWVIEDAKPKINQDAWNSYDIAFVERCIEEFDRADDKGFAFRYPNEGGERFLFDWTWLEHAMEHVRQVLDSLTTYLIEAHNENAEWEAFLESEYGGDLGW